jgi:hypothetical protein
MNRVRVLAAQACSTILGIFLVLVVVLQCRDFKAATEVFPVASFAVMLSMAAFAISWARVTPPNATAAEQRRVKRAALDLFMATVLTLVSAGLLRLAQDALLKAMPIVTPLLLLHALFLAVGLLIGWLALHSLLRQAVAITSDDPAV